VNFSYLNFIFRFCIIMPTTEEIIVKITGKDGLTHVLQRNATALNNLGKNSQNLGLKMAANMQKSIASVDKARLAVEKYNHSIEASKKQITGGLSPAMRGIDTRNLQKMGMELSTNTRKTEGLRSSVNNVKNSFSGLNGVISGLMGLGLGAWVMEGVKKARESADAWNKFSTVLGKDGIDLSSAKKQISGLASEHGFLTSQVRESSRLFIQAGASYQDVTKKHGALEAAMGISVATGRNLTESTTQLQRAYMGNGRALKLLGIDVKEYTDTVTGQIDKQRLNEAILEKTGKQLKEHGHSYESLMNSYEIAMSKLQVTIGGKVLPALILFIKGLTEIIQKFNELPSGVQTVIAAVGLFIASIAILAPVLSPVYGFFKGIWKVGKKVLSLFAGKKKLDISCDIPSSCKDSALDTDPKKGKKGRLGRLKETPRNIKGRIRGGRGKLPSVRGGLGGLRSGIGGLLSRGGGLLGRLSGGLLGGGLLGKLGGMGGLLGRGAGLFAGAARFAGPVGLAITAATAGYGAYKGWTETQGPWQEKAKGAMGGAVEQLSMGLVNKKQVTDGINWLYSQTKDIPGKIGGFLGKIKEIATKPFVDAWNTAKKIVNDKTRDIVNYIKSLPHRARTLLTNFANAVKQKILDAWNNAKNIVSKSISSVVSFIKGLPGRALGALVTFSNSIKQKIGDTWNNAKKTVNDTINGLVSTITGLPGRVVGALGSFASMVKGKILEALGPAKSLICSIIGCSPGIIPAFKELAMVAPQYLGSVIPYMEKLNNTINAPLTSKYTDILPTTMGGYVDLKPRLKPVNVPDVVRSLDGDNIPNINSSGGSYSRDSLSVVENGYHVHHHAPITVDARDMTRGEFKSLLLEVLEGVKRGV
jgi:hypothetical protein